MAIEAPKPYGTPEDGKAFFEFNRGTACGGVDYQPGDIGQIDARWASTFQVQGRGKILTAEEAAAKIEAKTKPAKKGKGGATTDGKTE